MGKFKIKYVGTACVIAENQEEAMAKFNRKEIEYAEEMVCGEAINVLENEDKN